MYIAHVHRNQATVYNAGVKTHIELDDAVLENVLKLGGFSTKKAAVNSALAEYAKLLARRELLAMRGKVRWEGNLDELRADRRSRW
jgi:Arc/MetJ family transcription regulator